ncbi:MAG: ferrochelatase [Planctomycetaceae bacterium]|nr:ferrochelatase [Planctomycetaceae bacterium]
MSDTYDALLFLSFGGPESRDDVIPFLENVLRGKNVPRERMLEVAEHYYHFGGVSPINQQCRDLIQAIEIELKEHGVDLPVYWGNRNWHPLLPDTMQKMKEDGVKRALAFFTSGYSSYSGCRQYRENVLAAQEQVGDGAPQIDKLRVFYNHPDFIAANVDQVEKSLADLNDEQRAGAHIAFTAHSIPNSMSDGCDYVKQLTETCRLVAEAVGIPESRYKLVYQSRSGRPEDPWLEPDILDHLRRLKSDGVESVVISPIGFLSDHMEVLFDLDEEAALVSQEIGLTMRRAGTVGVHPKFVQMIRKLIQERLDSNFEKEAVGAFGPNWDVCPLDCCPAPRRRPQPAS